MVVIGGIVSGAGRISGIGAYKETLIQNWRHFVSFLLSMGRHFVYGSVELIVRFGCVSVIKAGIDLFNSGIGSS